MNRTWLNEFGPAYDVPREITSCPMLEDTSWGNDCSPSFTVRGTNIVLWVEHPEPERREFGGPRFVVLRRDDGDSREQDMLYSGDNVIEALAIAITVGQAETLKRQ
jgi:hypothetical protein